MFIARDYLAMYRTELANERTLLAYFRTFIGTFAAGVGLVKLIDESIYIIIGYILMAISPIILIIGLLRYIHYRKKGKNPDIDIEVDPSE